MRIGRLTALLPLLLVAGLLVSASPAGGAFGSPAPTMPGDGASGGFLPTFGWSDVSGAARYEFEIAADPGFNAPVLGSSYDHFFTRNTRATLTKVVPNGTYWWHVRSVAADGAVSGWSSARSFTRDWAPQPTLQSPANGATITFPADAFRLSWTPVAGAVKYAVSVATDPALGTIVWSTHEPVVTQATTFTLSSPLAPDQTYYWGVTPIDSGGNKGSPSAVRSFQWDWPSTTTPIVTDIASAPEIYDPEFSWAPVAGAAGYELEISTSVDFATGSRICCTVNPSTGMTTLGTTYSPTLVLPNNNAYYWRVRAVDSTGNKGVWNVGSPFAKDFDEPVPSVRNLRMLDNPLPSEPDFETDTPIVVWDPVPGASSYLVEVTRFVSDCDWTASSEHWQTLFGATTATPAWTPLGSGWNGKQPFASGRAVSTDLPSLVAGHSYCVRVWAIDRPSSASAPQIMSDVTNLPAAHEAAFTWTGPPAGGACSPSCEPGALGSGDYITPIQGVTKRSMPLFRWKPLAGYESYFVLVSSDPTFSNLIDYAFTKIPAYAPRTGNGAYTYPDETNVYYWAVLPAPEANGGGVSAAPSESAPQTFEKRSLPPTLVEPAQGAVLSGPVHFRWTPTEGARRYQLQVSTDPSFASGYTFSDLVSGTDSTAYTSSVPFAADTALYWRVRADDELGRGLTWSAMGTFKKVLPAPVPSASNPTSGESLPSWSWAPIPGAVSYDVELTRPDGIAQTFLRIPSNVVTPTLMKGTGIWKLRAAANFPQATSTALTRGPWSPYMSFTRTIREPSDPSEDVGASRVVLSWDAKAGAQNYRVQISTREDFSQLVFDAPTTTDNPTYAPWLSSFAYAAGGTFYWRVAAADDVVANVGDFTTAQVFTIPPLPTTTTTTKAATTTTVAVTKTKSKIKAHGSVFPNHPGKKVTVTLYRKKSGSFVKLATRSPLLGATGYSTSFSRPKSGTCKIRSVFGGDADHKSSSDSMTFRC